MVWALQFQLMLPNCRSGGSGSACCVSLGAKCCGDNNQFTIYGDNRQHIWKRKRASPKFKLNCLHLHLHDIAAVSQNKVLVAAGVSAAIGQLSKPFTSYLLYGRDFDFASAFQAGGFPSTHSSAVVATATSLAFERGFSDSIFGLSVVYASLVMYDAQGVRREVGKHARVINKELSKHETNLTLTKDKDEGRLFEPNSSTKNTVLLETSDIKTTRSSQVATTPNLEAGIRDKAAPNNNNSGALPLKESIGHTEVEVIAGAFLGFFASVAVYSTL
ncbi:hypothetical protein K2173_004525 [Erythroxylum novogranatense]|uniref:Acid phosphatase/vanadium-dependent haloperoxidase-related protein n=1 Tax=Erythroxylum novogranatense TaxID=1862640 RepID=A0AAV8T5R3_9ROSI|nr:hypothetical protein K2173_004525 [Erythroxylum novogranatense]